MRLLNSQNIKALRGGKLWVAGYRVCFNSVKTATVNRGMSEILTCIFAARFSGTVYRDFDCAVISSYLRRIGEDGDSQCKCFS